MRIISGKYKGQILTKFKSSHIRPTTDQIKERIFNIISQDIIEKKALDLYAGTGNIGLEALSRGAKHVTFVENNNNSIYIINKNIEKLNIEKKCFNIYKKNVLTFLLNYRNEPFDYIFIDPPFTKKISHQTMKTLSISNALNENSFITIESSANEILESNYNNFICYKQKKFSNKVLSCFIHSSYVNS